MPDSSYLQRAELLADLGRYDEALVELAQAGTDATAQTLAARIRLVSDEPREALKAADAAVTAAPQALPAMIVRGMALAQLGRVDEAATQAEQILRRGRGDPEACTSAAAILAQGRAGQVALDAAWEGVRLAPEHPRAHLVLGLVAARLGLDKIAQRAYEEALTLDPQLPEAPAEAGLLRLEQQRYAVALARFAGPDRTRPDRSEPSASAPTDEGPVVSGPPAAEPVAGEADAAGTEGYPPAHPAGEPASGQDQLSRVLRRGGGYALLSALLVGWAHLSSGVGPLVALLVAGLGMAVLVLGQRRMSEQLRAELATRLPADLPLRLRVWALLAVPLLLFLYAMFAAGWLVVAAALAGAAAFLGTRRPGAPEPGSGSA